jgi:2-oxoglutarate ferredoxin oxidoreductase subunit gamma
METSQLGSFLSRLLPEGILVTESAGAGEIERKDIKVLKIPAISKALEVTGDVMGANLILLGAYIQATGILPIELSEKHLKEAFSGREKILARNLRAFEEGVALAQKVF